MTVTLSRLKSFQYLIVHTASAAFELPLLLRVGSGLFASSFASAFIQFSTYFNSCFNRPSFCHLLASSIADFKFILHPTAAPNMVVKKQNPARIQMGDTFENCMTV